MLELEQITLSRPTVETNIREFDDMGDIESMKEIDVLRDYSTGALARSVAMQRLGIEWYGDLLILLNQHGIPRPQVSEEDGRAMVAAMRKVFGRSDRGTQ